jgi:hypothetical protein
MLIATQARRSPQHRRFFRRRRKRNISPRLLQECSASRPNWSMLSGRATGAQRSNGKTLPCSSPSRISAARVQRIRPRQRTKRTFTAMHRNDHEPLFRPLAPPRRPFFRGRYPQTVFAAQTASTTGNLEAGSPTSHCPASRTEPSAWSRQQQTSTCLAGASERSTSSMGRGSGCP